MQIKLKISKDSEMLSSVLKLPIENPARFNDMSSKHESKKIS